MKATEEHIQDDLLCVECRYNLRTLHTDGRCPECGTNVAVTLQKAADSLRRAEQMIPIKIYAFPLLASWATFGALFISVTRLPSTSLLRWTAAFLFVLSLAILCILTPWFALKTVSLPKPKHTTQPRLVSALYIFTLLAGLGTIVLIYLILRPSIRH